MRAAFSRGEGRAKRRQYPQMNADSAADKRRKGEDRSAFICAGNRRSSAGHALRVQLAESFACSEIQLRTADVAAEVSFLPADVTNLRPLGADGPQEGVERR